MTDMVFLLHGLARSSRSMRRMSMAMRDGLHPVVLDYAIAQNLSEIVENVRRLVLGAAEVHNGRIHVVGHSMGGLIARLILADPPPNMGRLVQLGTPNRGSEIADLLSRTRLYRRVLGPAAMDLTTTRSHALVGHLPPISYECGVIAGTRSVDPLGWLVLPKPNDGRVSVASTMLEHADRLLLPVSHALMPTNGEVIRQTDAFIRHGRFLDPR